MGCHASKNAVSAVDTVPARRRCRANLKLDITISTGSSTSSSPRHSTCPPEDSLFEKLRLHSDESVCSSNNKASLSRHSDADTVLLTPVAVQAAVPGIVEETYSSSCPTGDLVLDSKPNLLSRVRDKATAVGDSTDDLSTGSEVESHGASEDHSGEEIVSGSESEVYGEGERVEAAATGASTRVETEHIHGNGWLSDSDGNASACERAQDPSAHPESTPQRVALSKDPCVPAELQRFLEQHRPPQPETANGSTSSKRPPSRVSFKSGLVYEGQLRRHDVVPHGWGRVTLPEGAAYEGEWLGGRVHGKGALRLPNGNAYWGSWALGRKHGLGTFVWADGSRHDGYYRAGIKSGVGTLHYASGAVFEGQFETDRRHGVGRLELPEGSSYDGEWTRDVPHGLGVFVDAARGGERFEGSWERGVRSGGGRLVQGWAERGQGGENLADAASSASADGFEDSAWYSGNFKDGLPHGEGAMGYGLATFCGHVEHGEWTGGGGVLDLGDGRGSFEGTFSNGLPRGSGRWRWEESGVEMDCTFEEGYASNIWPS